MKIRDTMDFWVLLTLVCLPTSALGSLCPGIVEEEVVLAEEFNKLPTCPARHISSGWKGSKIPASSPAEYISSS